MKSADYKPIPMPFTQRWRQVRATVLPLVVFFGAVVIIAFLWRDRVGAITMTGQADTALANVGTHQAGVLAGLRVTRFQKVRAGETIASVMIADPKLVEASLAVIRSELDMLRANLDPIASQQRNAVNFAQLRLNWMRQRADLATARVNLHLAESEYARAQELFKSRIASQSDLDIAKAAYDVLQKQVEELGKLVVEGEQSFTNLQPSNATDISRISDEPMRAAIAAQEAKLRLTEAELSPLKLYAPIDGTVTAVYFRSGESVTPGQPIITIVGDSPLRIVGYLRQPTGIEPKPGDQVQVRTRGRQRMVGTAQVLEVGSQFEALPLSMQTAFKLTGMELALPVNISLPVGVELRPGELVDLHIISAMD
jgi:multidrug resistance efflux pump